MHISIVNLHSVMPTVEMIKTFDVMPWTTVTVRRCKLTTEQSFS